MENASKALIMAATVLMGIMIISLGVYLFSVFGGTSKEISDRLSENQILEFNSQFTKYEGREDIRAHEVVSISNLAIKNNKQYEVSPTQAHYITIILKNTSGYNSNNFETKSDEYSNFIKDYSLESDNVTIVNFRCTEVHISNETRLVDKVVFEKIN